MPKNTGRDESAQARTVFSLASLIFYPANHGSISLPHDPAATEAMLRHADQEDLLNLALGSLQKQTNFDVRWIGQMWLERAQERRTWSGYRTKLMLDVLSGLRQAGIETLTIKGAGLAQDLYGDPLLRDHHDVDLVVRPRDAHRVAHWLAAEGFHPPCDVDWFADRRFLRSLREASFKGLNGAIEIDLHWRLDQSWNPQVMPVDELFRLATRQLPIMGHKVPWFDPVTVARIQLVNIMSAWEAELKSVLDFGVALLRLDHESHSALIEICAKAKARLGRHSCLLTLQGLRLDIGLTGDKPVGSAGIRSRFNSEGMRQELIGLRDFRARNLRFVAGISGLFRLIQAKLSPGVQDYSFSKPTKRYGALAARTLTRKFSRR